MHLHHVKNTTIIDDITQSNQEKPPILPVYPLIRLILDN